MLYIRNIMSQINYTSKAANSKKKRSDLWLPKVGVGEEGTE